MRIVSCYIENFGGLSKQKFTFDNGLNELNKPNGFGKTTLAEFIRAMFYGLGRGTTLASERKRYYPWSGGKYGGNLVFELDDKEYRIERYFGKTAKGDTFNLYDVKTNSISKEYSLNIGAEIFGLDSDSFIRSIYIKNMNIDGFNTNNIQARLTNLIEDTNDVNNYDKAINTLKDRKNNIISSRRQESTYKIACDNISELEGTINALQLTINEKNDTEDKYKECIKMLNEDKDRLEKIREITADIAKQQAKKSVEKQIEDINTELNELQAKYEKFQALYTKGLPTEEELESLFVQIQVIAECETLLRKENSTTQCIIDKYNEKFNEKPIISDINSNIDKLRQSERLKDKIDSIRPSNDKLARYEELYKKYKGNIPTEEEVADIKIKGTKLFELSDCQKKLGIDEAEQESKHIKHSLGGSVPSVQEVLDAQSKLDRVEALKNSNVNLALDIEDKFERVEQVVKTENSSNKKIVLAAGIVVSLIGIALGVIVNPILFSIVIIGLILAIVSFVIKPKIVESTEYKNVKVESSGNNQVKDRIRQNNTEIEQLNSEIGRFISTYINDTRNIRERLVELEGKAREYNKLQEVISECKPEYDRLAAEIMVIANQLSKTIYKEFDTRLSFDANIVQLQNETEEARKLHDLIYEAADEAEKYNADMKMLHSEVADYVKKYCKTAENLLVNLEELKSQAIEYENAVKIEEENNKKLVGTTEKLDEASKIIVEIREKYELAEISNLTDISKIKEDKSQICRIISRCEELNRQKEKIEKDNASLLKEVYSEEYTSLEQLRGEEANLMNEINELTEIKIGLENKRANILIAEDAIISKRDKLEYWVETRDECMKNSQIIDNVIELLRVSKQSLSLSYLNGLQRSFEKYVSKLMPTEIGAKISSNLDITVTKYGESRVKEYLSTGQQDTINLCMRLALIEAIFEKERPFIIMDDPFVNLDDATVRRCLDVLNDVSLDFQTIYMTCSDSRTA